MGAVVGALKEEAIAYGYLLQMVKQLLFEPRLGQYRSEDRSVRSKTTLLSFVTGFFSIAFDELIHSSQCKTCEEVVQGVCGDNFQGLQGKVALITGASNGLGLENARCLMKYGCHVIWAVRSPEKAASVLSQLEKKEGKLSGKATILKIELSDLTTVKPFVESFLALKLPLHYLICNAGIMSPTEWLPSKQNFELQFATNNLSHFLLTELLMPKLKETAATSEVRVVILSSLAGAACYNFDVSKIPCPKEEYNEFAEYAVSKALDGLHARHLQKVHPNIIGCAVHPGIIGTGLGGGNRGLTSLLYSGMSMAPFRKPVVKGAATTAYCALSPEVTAHAKKGHFFYFNCGPQRPRNILGGPEELVETSHQRQLELVRPYM
ncbi:unnamed protein product [Effrenium voratum]|nr:unnamed protein product [Effrenium voratum]